MILLIILTLLVICFIFNERSNFMKLNIIIAMLVIIILYIAKSQFLTWINYFICITWAGGLIILFQYMVTIINKTYYKKNFFFKLALLIIYLLVFLITLPVFTDRFKVSTFEETGIQLFNKIRFIINENLSFIIICIIIYIRLILIISREFTTNINSSLRKFFKWNISYLT